jgi:hypothetical protein
MKRLALLLGAVILFGYSNVVFAAFGVNLGTETFEGTFPPPGWSVACTNGSYGCWDKGSGYGTDPSLFSGSQAQSVYGNYLLDTSLITPAFSTMGFNAVNIEFSGYFYFYNGYGNKCDLQYSIDGGSNWNTLKTWDYYDNQAAESIALPAGALGQASVQLRWHRYEDLYPYYWAVVDDVKLVTPTPTKIPTLNEWGMIIMSLMLAGSAIWMIRRRQTE